MTKAQKAHSRAQIVLKNFSLLRKNAAMSKGTKM